MTAADIDRLDWEKMGGLVPVIVQHARSGRVLMLAFMNREALAKTLDTGLATFWSRTREKLWCKGETSGNVLRVQSLHTDCDRDSILLEVEPAGPTCHLGTTSCFLPDEERPGLEFVSYLSDLIEKRRRELPENSYTARLFRDGVLRIARKLGEEAIEVVVSASEEKQRSIEESADLVYHLLVFLEQREIRLAEVVDELQRRHAGGQAV